MNASSAHARLARVGGHVSTDLAPAAVAGASAGTTGASSGSGSGSVIVEFDAMLTAGGVRLTGIPGIYAVVPPHPFPSPLSPAFSFWWLWC